MKWQSECLDHDRDRRLVSLGIIPVSKLKIPFPPRLGRNAFINFCARSFDSAPRPRKSYLLLAQRYNRLASRPINIVNKYSNTFVSPSPIDFNRSFRQKNLPFVQKKKRKKIFHASKLSKHVNSIRIYTRYNKEKEFHLNNTYHNSRSLTRSFLSSIFLSSNRTRATSKREHRLIFSKHRRYIVGNEGK